MAFLAALLAAAMLQWTLADRWWPATVLLFGPRWVLGLPLLLLVPWTLARDRALLVPLALATLVLAGPVLGMRTGWRRAFVAADPARDLRVVSLNVNQGHFLAVSPQAMLAEWQPDVLALQECTPAIGTALARQPGWHAAARGSLCVASRHPIVRVDVMDRAGVAAAEGAGLVATYGLAIGRDTVRVTNVHFETPRDGLERLRAGDVAGGVAVLDDRTRVRAIEHRLARRWIDAQPPPHVVLGDFNAPPESRIFREAWGDFQDAYSRVGTGLGATRLNGWIRARIDHVLADGHFTVVDARTLAPTGSDHLPLLAVVRLRAR